MHIKTNAHTFAAMLTVILSITALSCKKQPVEEPKETLTPVVPPDKVELNAVNSSWSVNWDGYAHGTDYTPALAAADFGNASGWNEGRAMISSEKLRITLLKNALSDDGGLIAGIDIADGSAYELDFDVWFHSQFDWSRGGKVGFGFKVGDGNSGGDPGWDGNGGSLRLEWYQNDAGRVYFQPYVYYKDQPGEYGDTFGKSYPSTGSLIKGHGYHIHMYIKSNTDSSTNGRAQIVVDGTTLLDTPIRWTTNEAKRLIQTMSFSTFRGGSQTYWESPVDCYIYFDNLTVHRISS